MDDLHTESHALSDTAVHEAGHAVAAVVLGEKLLSVDVRQRQLPDGRLQLGLTDCEGVNAIDSLGMGHQAALTHVIRAFAGPVAEALVNPDFRAGHSGDIASVRELVSLAFGRGVAKDGQVVFAGWDEVRQDDRVLDLLRSAQADAIRLVDHHWEAISAVAVRLLEEEQLSGDDVASIVNADLRKLDW
jgi:ATP-dependent Zn protease